MKKSALLLILCLSILAQTQLKANHIIGGEMAYECIAPGEYLFKLTLFRDTFGTGPPLGLENITIYKQGTNTPFLNIPIEINPSDITSVESDSSNLCIENIPNLGIEQGVYEFLLELPNDPDGYFVVFQRCCRNQGILNINSPDNYGATYYASIPPSLDLDECVNNSAVFNNDPPILICMNNDIIFDQAATDLDGDSLVYEICPPLLGASSIWTQPIPATPPPYDEVPWIGVYSSEYQIPSDPAMTIDSQTGELSLNPTQQGLYVTAICVHEYRDGEIINTVSRDFQFNIIDCELLSTAISSNVNGNTDLAGDLIEEISFSSDTIIGCAPMTISFSNATQNADHYYWDFGNDAPQEFTENPFAPIIYEEAGIYTAFMIAYQDFCDLEDTLFFNIEAIEPLAPITPIFEAVLSDDCEDLTMNFINQTELPIGTEDDYTYEWELGNGQTAEVENIEYSFFFPGNYGISLTITGPAPCYTSYAVYQTITVDCNVATEDKYQYLDKCQVYPNPSADLFQLELAPSISDQEGLSIKVYDITGQLILSQTDTTIDLSNQGAGIYLLQIFHKNLLIEQEKLVLMK